MMLPVLLVVLAVLAVTVSANSAAEDVPHVPSFGQRVARAIFAGKMLNTAAHSKVLPHSEKKVQSTYSLFDRDQMVNEKLYVTRTRPNGDCSGPVIQESAWVMDRCNFQASYPGDWKRRLSAQDSKKKDELGLPYITYGMKMTCEKVSPTYPKLTYTLYSISAGSEYDATTCDDGNDYYDYDVSKEGDACATEQTYAVYTGPRMLAQHCGTVPQEMLTERPGLYFLYYNSPKCDATPAGYSVTLFDVCHMFIDYQDSSEVGVVDDYTKFYYIKMTSFENDLVEVRAFSDPACSQRLIRSHFNLNTHPDYETCSFDNTVGLATSMFYGTSPFADQEK